MEKDISLYKEIEEPVVVFHKPVAEPHRNIPHLHSQYEFCYNIQGADGMFVDKKLYKCEGHDLFLIPQTCVHRILVPKGAQYERCIINLDASFVDAINAVPGIEGALTWLGKYCSGAPLRVRLNDADHQSFVELVDAYLSSDRNQVSRLSVLIQILVFLEKQFRFAREGEVRQAESLAEQALVIIEESFRHIKVSQLSKELYVNSGYLSDLFKEAYGITPGQYLLLRKVAEAKKHLYLGRSGSEACALSGFGNYTNFIRTFKKIEGYPPGSLEKLDPL